VKDLYKSESFSIPQRVIFITFEETLIFFPNVVVPLFFQSDEALTVSITYLDHLITMPWNKKTVDNLDLGRARTILDEDHYDVEKVKDRILEFLAVKKR